MASMDDSLKTEDTLQSGELRKQSTDRVQFLQIEEGEDKPPVFTCSITHPLVIEKVYVLYALKDFVSEFHADSCP